ncbi:MAG: molybdopterin-dependent oxidoreductase [Myxococcales bacterium]|nr:molybdopterin-dependent oxidoreductase [Myxococcales bacterium]
MARRPQESRLPFGIGGQKPKHYREMFRIAWENRRHPAYAMRVLRDGVCDGCALGTSGLSDWTMDGTHLCLVRLNLLRLNTLDALDPATVEDVSSLRDLPQRELHELGRLPYPMRRRRGEPGFTRVTWDEALADMGGRIAATRPDRIACYMTSRALGNEVYFATQKAWRYLGSPHIDNAARLCHSPSTAAMKKVLGVAASTCSYTDWYGSDLIVFFGSNPANDQPVALKYLIEAKKLGTKVLVVNTFREPGMSRYWVPSTADSAVFGSPIADGFFHVSAGGDHAFAYAVQKLLLERGAIEQDFIDRHTTGFAGYRSFIDGLDLDELIARSGSSREQIEEFARHVEEARTGVFVWSMGLTQHATGTQSIEALCCLGLSQAFVGREKCGLMPIRGHSGVQGGAEMGAYATAYPGGKPIENRGADALERAWGFRPPVRVGLDTCSMLEAALAGRLDALYAIGGNFLDTLPQPADVHNALASVPMRIHQDIVLSRAMLVEPKDVVYLLPARTRYEHRGGITETTTERRVIFSPHVPGHEIGEAREEWRIPIDIATAAKPESAQHLRYADAAAVRRDIADVVETYRGIEQLENKGDQFQWGGPRLCEGGQFPLPEGRARFAHEDPRDSRGAEGQFLLGTRRGKQFNSIVQAETDHLTGAARDHLFMNVDDMKALGLSQDGAVEVTSDHGSVRARAFAADITRGNVQMHWPEANPLIASGVRDAGGLVPDYNASVRIAPVAG